MTLTGASGLYIAELVLYLLVSPIALYLGRRHGRHGILGYFYLSASCGVRIAADIVSLLPSNRDATHPSISTAILASIGLSPLLLALSGFLHEVHVRLVDVTQSTKQIEGIKRWLWIAQFKIHGVAVLGMVPAIVGNIKLVSGEGDLTPVEVSSARRLRDAGAVLLLILWACLAQYALYLLYVAHKVCTSSSGRVDFQRPVGWILIAMPFAGLRCISSILYTFDHQDSDLSPITGALWVKVVMVVLASLGVVLSVCVSGWLSRGGLERSGSGPRGSSNNVDYEAVTMSTKVLSDTTRE